MDSQQTPPLHPLLKVAAGSVIVASAVVVASLTGLLPKPAEPQVAQVAVTAPAAPAVTATLPVAEPAFESLQAPAAGIPVTAVATVPAPAPKAVAEAEGPAPVVKKPRPRIVSHEEAVTPPPPPPAPVICYSCGTVQSVNVVTEAGKASGAGAVTGAVLGGVAGHQMGGGKGKDAMTVIGVIGGALAGNATEKAIKKTQFYEVTVRMEDGNVQTYTYQAVPPFSAGDAVRVDGGQLMRRY